MVAAKRKCGADPLRKRRKKGSPKRRAFGVGMITPIESLRRVIRLRAARFGT